MELEEVGTTKTGVIEKVNKQYYDGGWYIGILVNFNGSHAFIFYENINSVEELITSSIRDNRIKYEVV